MLPIALLCLFDEQRRMHRARQLVAQVPAIVPLGCFVDGLFYTGPPEADKALRKLAGQEKYEHVLTNVFQFKEACMHQVPQQQQHSDTHRLCFKPKVREKWFSSVTEEAFEQYLAANPLDDKDLQEKARFNSMCAERGVPLLSSVSYVIVAHAIANGGMLCVAPAGCGKSVLLKQTKAVLAHV